MSTPGSPSTSATKWCVECKDLVRGRQQAAGERDLSKVTDFNVLIVRHRMAHAEGS